MPDSVINVENLSKRYLIGHQRSKEDGFRHVLEDAIRAPLSWVRSGRQQAKPEQEEFWALKDVSFEVKRGDVVGLIGRNGAGKSTLLKILSRITEPTSGRIVIDGRVASLLEVGTGFHPELTGRENIFLNGAILGMSRVEIKRKFDEIVAFSEIEKFLDTPVKRYSSGMYVRLAFAVAAHLEPEILIVDEVLAVGDQQFQNKCIGKMQEVAQSGGRTVLFVSHQMETIDRLTKQCVWMSKGSVFRTGETKSVVSEYLNSSKNQGTGIAEFRASRIPNSIEIVAAFTCDDNQNPMRAFRQGERITVMLAINALVKNPFDVAVVIENEREQALFTTHLTDTSSPVFGTGMMKFAVPLFPPVLRRGGYKVSLAVYSPDKRDFFDVVHHLPLFEVAGTADRSFPDDIRWGDLFLRLPWTIYSQSP